MSRKGMKRKPSAAVTITAPEPEANKFYFAELRINETTTLKAVTDLTRDDLIRKAKRVVKNPKNINVKILQTWKRL